jgi:hypothetical protein
MPHKVILNSWLVTIANLIKGRLKMSLPTVVRGDSRKMEELRSLIADFISDAISHDTPAGS